VIPWKRGFGKRQNRSCRNADSFGRPKNKTYPSGLAISKPRSPSWVSFSGTLNAKPRPTNSAVRASGSSTGTYASHLISGSRFALGTGVASPHLIKSALIGTQQQNVDVDECFGLLATVEPKVTYPDRRLFGQVTRSPNSAASRPLSFISRTTMIKLSASYFACASPATTAATLSSIWFQPSI
jgi:hypothetical protein